nr:MAG TPA_asm: Cytochrome c [Caudoviricetes sp.]
MCYDQSCKNFVLCVRCHGRSMLLLWSGCPF